MKEEIGYQIASRATILLGREGLSKSDGALVELIKNAYDADATFCFVDFDVENDCIRIVDNGTGMTRRIIVDSWMTIGTDNKKREFQSNRNRIKSGEKGIGRFALDRLGGKCTMYTRHEDDNLIKWTMDWSSFEKPGQTLNQVKAQIETLEGKFGDFISAELGEVGLRVSEVVTGTFLSISVLRDVWSIHDIDVVCEGLKTLIPPTGNDEFSLYVRKNRTSAVEKLVNEFQDQFDYRVKAFFDGITFNIELFRNELNLSGIPSSFFERDFFKNHPYKLEDLKRQILCIKRSPEELLGGGDSAVMDLVRRIGAFSLDVMFLKLTDSERKCVRGFHKKIDPRRKMWMERFSGIKIYRDSFAVRPYGDPRSSSHDWLGLNARKAANPVAVSHKSLQWHVNNSQIIGSLFISRVNNPTIADKSSREGLIENAEFRALCEVLKAILAIMEKDRAQIERQIKEYSEEVDEALNVKEKARKLARRYLSTVGDDERTGMGDGDDDRRTYAKAVQYLSEELNELASEIKMLKALATNGLITTTLVHDLKSINGQLCGRVDILKQCVRVNDRELLMKGLEDLLVNDKFLKSWISVVANLSRLDKRKRIKTDVVSAIRESIELMRPILDRKRIVVKEHLESSFYKKVFRLDIESIVYNLIINSIEAFESGGISGRMREIRILCKQVEDRLLLTYADSGPGLIDAYKANPNEILDYGVSSKVNTEGVKIGTGLGMYIVATNVQSYNGKCDVKCSEDGFLIEIEFPGE